MHINPDLKTKKALKEAIKAGKVIMAFQPGDMFPAPWDAPGIVAGTTFDTTIEGPADYHKWYARAEVSCEGRVLKVIS